MYPSSAAFSLQTLCGPSHSSRWAKKETRPMTLVETKKNYFFVFSVYKFTKFVSRSSFFAILLSPRIAQEHNIFFIVLLLFLLPREFLGALNIFFNDPAQLSPRFSKKIQLKEIRWNSRVTRIISLAHLSR